MSLTNAVGNLAIAKELYDLDKDTISNLRNQASSYQTGAQTLADTYADKTAFQAFSVSPTMGGKVNVGASGGLDLTLGDQQKAIAQNLLDQAQTLSGQGAVTSQSLFDQLQSMRSGENERTRLELENRLAAQGRLGTQTAAYGGTPEALAMEKAFAEQQSADLFNALQLAPQLQQQQTANIGGLLTGSTMPEQQLLNLLGAATPLQTTVQAGRQGAAEVATTLGKAGLEADVAAQLKAAEMESERKKALGQALQGLFAGEGGSDSIAQTVLGELEDGLKKLLGL